MRKSLQHVRRLRWASFCRCLVLGPSSSKLPASSISHSWPPPTPLELLAAREAYEKSLATHKAASVAATTEDTPLYCLYRLYEHLILNHRFGLRNEIEYFWHRSSWTVADIPDPKDEDAARYAVLSCIPNLLVEAFNRNIGLGLPRDAPTVMTDEEMDELSTREKKFETLPSWTFQVPPLKETLRIPHEDSQVIDNMDDERASPVFKAKNVLIWNPHIHFI